MNAQGQVKLVGWIIWWLELIFMFGGTLLTWMGSSMMSGVSMMGGGSMMTSGHWIFGMGMLLGSFWLVWRIVIQVVAFVAIRNLDDASNLAWPIVLIVLGVLGGFLYLVPGVWALILVLQNNNQAK